MPHANAEAMNLHLAEIWRQVARDTHAAVIMDGAGWHTAHTLVIPANITIIHLPPYAHELNPVENIWEFLRKNYLTLRVHENYAAIVDACCHAWSSLMAMPDEIASIATRDWANMS